MGTYSDYEQRQLDQQSGAELDRVATRSQSTLCPNVLGGEKRCTLTVGHAGPCDFYGYSEERRSQENCASISLRRPSSFPGMARTLMERRKPVTELNPHRVRVLRKQAQEFFALARKAANVARPFWERRPTDPYSYDFEVAEAQISKMQDYRERALVIFRTIRAAKIVDGRGQKWGPAGREFRDDYGNAMEKVQL